MQKRWLLNLALLAFLVALVLLVKYQPGAPDKEREQRPPLTAIQPDQIQKIRILRPDQDEIAVERDGEEWRMTAPWRARADHYRVEGVLSLATARTEARFPAQDLPKYGLDKPLATVWLDNTEIQLGALHPLNELQYVLYNNDIALIPAASFRAAATQADDFLSPALMEKSRKPISFKLPKFSLVLQDGSWQRQPEIKDLSGDRINNFVEEWRYARALSVTRHAPKPPVGKISIGVIDENKDKANNKPEALAIDILSYQPEFVLYRKDENLDYHFPKDTGERLLELKPE